MMRAATVLVFLLSLSVLGGAGEAKRNGIGRRFRGGRLLLICFSAFVLQTTSASGEAQEAARLLVGDHVMIARQYDSQRDVFLEGARDGEGEACFQVKELRKDGAFLDHLTGSFKPWWSDEVKSAGSYDDVWSTSDDYRENHPEADALAELRLIFKTVARCE